MKILNNIKAIDLALYLDSTLVISDVHIGYEEALIEQGYLIPRYQYKDTLEKINKILFSYEKYNKIIPRIGMNPNIVHLLTK